MCFLDYGLIKYQYIAIEISVMLGEAVQYVCIEHVTFDRTSVSLS